MEIPFSKRKPRYNPDGKMIPAEQCEPGDRIIIYRSGRPLGGNSSSDRRGSKWDSEGYGTPFPATVVKVNETSQGVAVIVKNGDFTQSIGSGTAVKKR